MQALDEQWRTAELPTTDAEIWRYSRIGELDLHDFEPADHAPNVEGPQQFVTCPSALVDLFPDDRPDVFADVSASLAATVHVVVPAGEVVPQPIIVTHTVG